MDEVVAAPVNGRPLWRKIADFPLVALVIAIACFIAATATAVAIDRYVPHLGVGPDAMIFALLTIALLFVMYKVVIRQLGERHHDDLPARGSIRLTAIGVGIGFVLMAVSVGVAAIADVYNISGYGGTSELLYDAAALALIPGFTEELLFRGILFRWIEEFGGSWAALIITSALFGLAHIMNPNATWFSSFAISVEAGLLLGAAYLLTRSLWLPIGLHAAWNFTQGFLFDVPVSGLDEHGLVEAHMSGPAILSGGQFGLEASIIALVIATSAGLWLLVRAVREGQVMKPWWVRRRPVQT